MQSNETSYVVPERCIVLGAGAEKILTPEQPFQLSIKAESVNKILHTVMSPEEFEVVRAVIIRAAT